jgi:cytosine permease
MKVGEDYALERIPEDQRRPMWEVFMIRFGTVACLSQFILGAALGYGMTFRNAIISTLLGVVLLEIVSFFIGVAGVKEGLSTSVLTRWTGFGQLGSSLIGLIIAISCIGWFGIQNSIFAEGLMNLFHSNVSFAVMSIITGLAVTVLVVYGYKMLSYTANIAVPAFLIAVLYAMYKMLTSYDLNTLISMAAPGEPMSIGVGVTMVAGGFMVGAIITPDLSRYNRSVKDVFWMTLLSLFLGELFVNIVAVLMAHAVKSPDVVSIMLNLGGWIAAALVIFSTIKINDMNLYGASLGATNFLETAFGIRSSRALLTLIIGCLGTLGSVLGILDRLVNFLVILGVTIPPIGGIIIVDYFILKRSRKELDESKLQGKLPKTLEFVNPIALISWLAGFLVGHFVSAGIPALNSLFVAAISYYIISKIYALVVGEKNIKFFIRSTHTEQSEIDERSLA